MNKMRLKQTRFSIWYVVIALALVWGLRSCVLDPMAEKKQEVSYDVFREDLKEGRIESVEIGDRIRYERKAEGDGEATIHNTLPVDDKNLVPELLSKGVEFRAVPTADPGSGSAVGWLIFLLPLALIWWLMIRRMAKGGPGGMLSVGKSKAREISGEMSKVTFDDVGGADEVEVELKEIIEFLKDPTSFQRLGAKLPPFS